MLMGMTPPTFTVPTVTVRPILPVTARESATSSTFSESGKSNLRTSVPLIVSSEPPSMAATSNWAITPPREAAAEPRHNLPSNANCPLGRSVWQVCWNCWLT